MRQPPLREDPLRAKLAQGCIDNSPHTAEDASLAPFASAVVWVPGLPPRTFVRGRFDANPMAKLGRPKYASCGAPTLRTPDFSSFDSAVKHGLCHDDARCTAIAMLKHFPALRSSVAMRSSVRKDIIDNPLRGLCAAGSEACPAYPGDLRTWQRPSPAASAGSVSSCQSQVTLFYRQEMSAHQ